MVEQGLFLPYAHPREAEIRAACARFHECLNITEGATHLEVMVPDDGPVELIDFNLRFAGLGSIVLASEVYGLPFARFLTDLALRRGARRCPRSRPTTGTRSTWRSCRRRA